MGLDGVELVMRVEERFGVEIEDAEAGPVTTPGMLIDLVFSKLPATEVDRCCSQRAFYLLRRALGEQYGTARKEIRPETGIRAWFAGEDSHNRWFRLQEQVGAKSWPGLELRPRDQELLKMAHLSVFFLSFTIFMAWLRNADAILLALMGGFAAVWISSKLAEAWTAGFRRYPPARIKILRDLVPFVETSGQITWTRARAAAIISGIVIDQLGLEAQEYREEARFVEDLGLD